MTDVMQIPMIFTIVGELPIICHLPNHMLLEKMDWIDVDPNSHIANLWDIYRQLWHPVHWNTPVHPVVAMWHLPSQNLLAKTGWTDEYLMISSNNNTLLIIQGKKETVWNVLNFPDPRVTKLWRPKHNVITNKCNHVQCEYRYPLYYYLDMSCYSQWSHTLTHILIR